jgi:hypothetical protein
MHMFRKDADFEAFERVMAASRGQTWFLVFDEP